MEPIVKYIIITPVRNEQKNIEFTLQSVISQSIIPIEWVIINDGSRDNTGSIIDKYAQQYPWIHTIHRKDRGYRKPSGGVVEAFYDGYNSLRNTDFDFLVKLDGDLSFQQNYFAKCFEFFRKESKLGIGGGVIHHEINGSPIPEMTPLFHVRGATKIYRKACWDDIHPLLHAPGWDTLDEVKANMLGWFTRSFTDLIVIHHRYTGSADGTWKNLVKFGRANYISGYHPLFMIAKCLRRMLKKPYIIGGISIFYGYISGPLKAIPQVDDKELKQFLRKQQINRLLGRDSMWK